MIKVTKLNRDELFVSADLIETVETQPETAITMPARIGIRGGNTALQGGKT